MTKRYKNHIDPRQSSYLLLYNKRSHLVWSCYHEEDVLLNAGGVFPKKKKNCTDFYIKVTMTIIRNLEMDP